MNRFSNIALSLVCLVGFELSGLAQSSTITTYAGSEPGLPVSGTQAITQSIGRPVAVVLDAFGGFYFASSDQNRIYRVAADGMLTVIAGTGKAGFSGDNGPGVSAQLKAPSDIALDAVGNLFIADSGNHRIREITPNGVIRTVAGGGMAGFRGDGGSALYAQLNAPGGVAADGAGNLFISDSGNHRIREITPDGVISTVAGDGTPGFSGDGGPATAAQVNAPWGIAVDGIGNLFIADYGNNRIRKVDPAGIVATVAGDGKLGCCGIGSPAISASLGGPSDVALDPDGNLFIAEFSSWFIRKITPAGTITSGAGGTDGNLIGPVSVAVDGAGDLFIADSVNRIRRVDPAGIMTPVAGVERGGFSGDFGSASSAELKLPADVAVDTQGNLFIADTGNHRIRKVDAAGIISTVAGSGAVGEEGGFSGDGGPATAAQLRRPGGIAVDAQGNLFIADTGNHRIRKVDAAGIITTIAGVGTVGFSGDGGAATSAGLNYPQDVAVDGAGNLFVSDSGNGSIRKVTPAGIISTVAGIGRLAQGFSGGDGGPATSVQLRYPSGIAVDAEGNLFIADTGNHRIRKVDAAGTISTVAGSGAVGEEGGFSGDGGPATAAQLRPPWGIAVDAQGNLFIADPGNHRIRKVTHDGVITTVAGVGKEGFSGDFGPAASAQLSWPMGVAVDQEGNLFIADTWNHRIRKVTTLMGPLLNLDSIQYRVGDSWNLKVGYGGPNTPVRLLGTSDGQSWEIQGWRTTDGSGTFKVEGMFAEGTEGSHALQVEIGGVFSNVIAFVVSRKDK